MNRPNPLQRIAVVGAGIAGLACARTLLQAGRDVHLFESAHEAGGRMATQGSAFGSFDSGAQYFTVRDPRFADVLQAVTPGLARRWSVSSVRVLDELGRVVEAAPATPEAHWVAIPGMSALARHWADPLAAGGRLHLATGVLGLAQAGPRWQLHTSGPTRAGRTPGPGFDAVALAMPAPDAAALLATAGANTTALRQDLDAIALAPCWTLMLAFPQAAQPGLQTLGPQWNAARSTHHRVAWLARESSKPQRGGIERWTVQASSDWSSEHAHDAPERVRAKLIKAFGEITGIRAVPAHAQLRWWPHARTIQALGKSHAWEPALDIGLCGDWCLGQRVEDAFVSGLELALDMLSVER